MRIAIVNDMMLAVEAMRRVIAGSGKHQVAWVARDGAQAVERCAADTPDLILMDLIMPGLGGVEATRQIMAKSPCAILVVTANVTQNSSKVFEALGAGALDAVNTPVLESPGNGDGAQTLLAKIETIRRLIGPLGQPKRLGQAEPRARAASGGQSHLVALGASAGGPSALARVLSVLPTDFPAPIAIVQHVDQQFAAGLADWLNEQTALEVTLAREGDRLEPGRVLIAGGEHHLVLASPTRLSYSQEPIESSYRPSVDAFFKSANQVWAGAVIGVVLTGMGRDGAEGLLALRQSGHHTIAQDEATSAVFGMPKAAAQLQAASEVLALEKIGPRLVSLLAATSKMHV